MKPSAQRYIGAITQWITAAVGVYLVFSPAIWDYARPAAAVDRVVGPLIASFGIIAAWEATRSARRVNFLSAAILLILPWFLDYPVIAVVNSVVIGIAVALLASVPYPPTHRFGDGWASLVR